MSLNVIYLQYFQKKINISLFMTSLAESVQYILYIKDVIYCIHRILLSLKWLKDLIENSTLD